jgi:rod shape-determining protein MreC
MKGVKNFSINKKNNNWLKFLIGAVVLLFLLFVINIFNASIKNDFYIVSSPIQKTFWSIGESSSVFLSSLFNAGFLTRENENLKNENQKLLSEVASLQSIEQGNQAQSDISVACQNSGFKFIMAGVIGLDDNDILSINKGSADGISEGMPVINQQNVLFGKIFKVYKNFSDVMLVSNKNSVVNVKVQQSDLLSQAGTSAPEIDGVVKGNGGLSAYLDLIPINSVINLQDVLVTSAIEKSFPKDLLVGKIVQKEKNDQKPFQQAQISLFFNVKSVNNLFVITNYKQNN